MHNTNFGAPNRQHTNPHEIKYSVDQHMVWISKYSESAQLYILENFTLDQYVIRDLFWKKNLNNFVSIILKCQVESTF